MNDFLRLERLRGLREDKDLKQEDIAKILNITQSAYSYYELGKRQMPIETVVKLAYFYNTSVDYLLGITDVRKPYPKSIVK